jgi:bifunctional non-homologous end joining protein LigD
VSAFRFIQPCSPIRAKAVPAGDGWLHEVKFYGYRVQVHKLGSRVVIYSRNGQNAARRLTASKVSLAMPLSLWGVSGLAQGQD